MKGYFTGKPIPKDPEQQGLHRMYLSINGYNGPRVWKDRLHNIPEVEKLRNEATTIRKPLSVRWVALYDTVHPLVHVQGNVDGKRYYLHAGRHGISFCAIHDEEEEEKIKYILNEDLPTYVGREEELSENDRKLLKDRLKGPKASKNKYAIEASVRNDLIKEYLYLDSRFNTLNKVTKVSGKAHDFSRGMKANN